MNQRKAFLSLKLLLLLAVLLITGGFFLRRFRPDLYLAATVKDEDELKMAKLSTYEELPLAANDTAAAKKNDRGILSWPHTSMVTDYHKADLSLYKGRSRNEKALEGISIFLDVGESEVEDVQPSPGKAGEALQKKRENAAATDPVTGFPLSPYSTQAEEKKSDETDESMEKGRKPDIPKSQILPAFSEQLQSKLEALGAKVITTRSRTEQKGDLSQAAVLASDISQHFVQELQEQKFRCTDLENLIPTLMSAVNHPQEASVSAVFSANGASPELRLLLDVERQYTDVLFLSLRLSESKGKENGLRALYFGDSLAASSGAAELSQERPGDQPAYLAYGSSSRRRLAEFIERNARSLVPEISYKGNRQAVSEEALPAGRFSNVTAVQVALGFSSSENDMKTLVRNEVRESLADAIAGACFQFYCEP